MKTFKFATALLFIVFASLQAQAQISAGISVNIPLPVPVVYAPAPRVVYVEPRPVYVERPVYIERPARVVYVKEKRHFKHGKGHHKKHGCRYRHHH